jgi:hypothetical protein
MRNESGSALAFALLLVIGGTASVAGAVTDFADVQDPGLDNFMAVVKLVDQNGRLRGY